MNLVCFANNTGGGLVCDLLNNKFNINSYKTANIEHSKFKIGDTPTVQFLFDIDQWNRIVDNNREFDSWGGTHIHPSVIPDLSIFNRVIAITTHSRNSKLYRFLRYYHGWFCTEHPNWTEDNSLATIDKIRELAKNVFVEFVEHPDCENIEFEHIVNGNFVTNNNLNIEYFTKWKLSNPWLYNIPEWSAKRFNEAEWELTHKKPYRYV
jgi:hypothetical protein